MPEPHLTSEMIRQVHEAEQAFVEMTEARHRGGQVKYGNFTFLEMPTLEMCLEELADLANYARFCFIKVYMLRKSIEGVQQQTIGQFDGFFTTDQVYGVFKEQK